MTHHPRTVAVAESCTGGLLASEMSAIPGCGDWFVGGVVAYHADVKFQLLGVAEGPVISAEAAMAMAQGVRELLGTDIGISITGVAGPEPEEGQPTGTVFIGVSEPQRCEAMALVIEGDPDRIRAVAVESALTKLRQFATEIDFGIASSVGD
jgi:nicotinamide-nucleotide amidase